MSNVHSEQTLNIVNNNNNGTVDRDIFLCTDKSAIHCMESEEDDFASQ